MWLKSSPSKDRPKQAQPCAEPALKVLPPAETYRLKFQWQDGREEVVPVNRQTITVGRHGTNDVVLRESSIAPFHAEFQAGPREADLRVVDVGMEGGLWVGEDKVRMRLLYDGDVIRLGEHLRVIVQCCSLSSLHIPEGPELLRISDAAAGVPLMP